MLTQDIYGRNVYTGRIPFDPTGFLDEDDEFCGHRHRGHVGPGVHAHTDQHGVQRLMRAVQVGGRDLTDQLAIAS